MPTVKGRAAAYAFIDNLPQEVETKLLRGAARAGANVIADDAKERAASDEVKEGITVRVKREPDRIVGTIGVVGAWARSLGIWAEYGTDPHYISVDDTQRGGRSIGRVNREVKSGSLVINGQAVGKTVFHPGARKAPFLRPALDLSSAQAVAAAQAFITARVTRAGIVGPVDSEDDDQ